MTIRLTATAVVALAAAAALPASAQNIRPGLWEMNNKMQSDNPQMAQAMAAMQKQMASMPPEQRKAMEDAMAKHGGMKLESAGDGGMLVKMCLTKEVIQDALFGTPQTGNCTHTKTPMVGNTMSYSFSCGNPASTGEGKVTFSGDTAYTSRMTMSSSPSGKKETMTVDSRARWLGADCGNVKPLNPKGAAAAVAPAKK